MPRQHIALVRAALHTLAKFRFHRPCVLVHSVGLIQIDRRRSYRKQLQKVLCHRVKIMNIAFQRAELLPFQRLFFHLCDRRLKAVCFLRAICIPPALLERLLFLADPVQAVHESVVRQDHFRRGIDPDRLQLRDRPLTEHVEGPDGIHFVAPQLNSIGVLLRQLKDIQDIAADRELARLLHLVLLLIAQKDQPLRRLRERELASLSHLQDALFQHVQGHLRRHQRRERRDHGRRTPFHQAPQTLDPLCIQFSAPEVRLIKDQVFGRKEHDVSVIEAVCLLDFSGSLVAVRHDQAKSRCRRERLLPGKCVDQMELLRLRAPLCQNTGRAAGKRLNYAIVILRLLQWGC